jgi:hypothetical protein
MKLDKDSAGLITLGAVQGISIFTALMPDRGAVYMGQGDAIKMDVRNGEMVSSVLTIGLSALIACLVRDPLPLWIGMSSAVTMVAVYETLLARNPR